MPVAQISEADFIRLFEALGAAKMAAQTGQNVRAIYARRKAVENRIGRQLTAPEHYNSTRHGISHPERATFNIKNGVVLVGSDLHAWPGEKPTAFRAFVKFCKILSPAAVIMNGDVIDGSTISRHPPLGWEKLPTLIEEIETAQEWLHDIVLAVPKATKLFWPAGNHDARFSQRVATVIPEYAKIHGVRLQDHFGERWTPCWSVWLNQNVVVKHRHKNGIHATHNSTMWAGKTMVTGHLHSLKVSPFTDYNETRFGVDTGCLADPYGPQFRYSEDNPRNHRAGFVVLTFKDSKLLWPELVAVVDEKTVQFRGELIRV